MAVGWPLMHKCDVNELKLAESYIGIASVYTERGEDELQQEIAWWTLRGTFRLGNIVVVSCRAAMMMLLLDDNSFSAVQDYHFFFFELVRVIKKKEKRKSLNFYGYTNKASFESISQLLLRVRFHPFRTHDNIDLSAWRAFSQSWDQIQILSYTQSSGYVYRRVPRSVSRHTRNVVKSICFINIDEI